MHQQTIAQELFLLCYEPTTGRPTVDSTHLACGAAGAMLAELALAGDVSVVEDHVHAARHVSVGEPQLDTLLARIVNEKHPRTVQWWVQKTQSAQLHTETLRSAVMTCLLHHEQRRVLGIFPQHNYYPQSPGQREELRQRLATTLWSPEDPQNEDRALTLLALCGAVGVDHTLLPEIPKKERQELLKQATENSQVGAAVTATLQAIQTAIIGAVAAGTATTAVVGN